MLRSPQVGWRRLPLRVKLVAAMLVLVVAALAGSGIATTTTLRSYLVGRVDDQLAQVAQATAQHGGADRDRDDGADAGRDRLPSAYVVEVVDGSGTVVSGPTSNLTNADEPLPAFPHLSAPQTGGNDYRTVDAVNGGRQWRLLASPVQLTDGSTGTLMIAQSLADVQNTVGRLDLLLLVIGACALLVLAAVGYLVVRASLRPLVQVEHTAAAIAGGDLTRRVPDTDPRTEIGRLSAALNRMLAEIESAFTARELSEASARRSEERMRRFVADASHELRTPLTSIRGFAELYRHGAASGEGEVARMMRRIEGEASRMALLVEDLLTLARLDQQRPLARDPVDVLALAADAVHDAQAVDRQRPIRLELGPTDPPPIVIGDESRLRQVLANLVGNALQHTPAATPVTVRISTGASASTGEPCVLLDISDAGPGMSAEDAARVFERFYRADTARSRADGGTGLGLAIVSALVAAHGGTVELETAPGAGARFRVELPLAAVPVADSNLPG